MRYDIYWPSMRKDCEEFTMKCKPCQLYSSMNHKPFTSFTHVSSPCPFFMWGMDLVGPLPKSSGQRKFVIVVIDYHTKSIEAKSLGRIRENDVIKFFMEFIVFRFEVPRIIVTDNGSQFVGSDFKKTLNDLKIQHVKVSMSYPQSNGQFEITNKAVLQGIKKRLVDVERNWVDELPNILWSHRITPRASTGEPSFKLAYGTEAIFPVEIGVSSLIMNNLASRHLRKGYASTVTCS